MKRLEADEIRRLIAAVSGRCRAAVEFMARTGARVSEALAVRADDVDTYRGVVTVPTLKNPNQKNRVVKIGNEYAGRLLEEGRGQLFRVTRQAVHKAMQKAAKAAGIARDRAHPHALRHGFAIRQVEEGVPAAVLMRWLGHASLKTTTIYVAEVEAEKFTPAGFEKGDVR